MMTPTQSILSRVIHYPDTNSVEATWVDSDGNVVRCHSYSDRQMDMLRADLGAEAANYAALIADVEAAQLPLPPVVLGPVSCSPWQIRKALNITGLRQSVEDAVSASGDITLQDGWEFATEFRSDDSFVLAMGASVGKTADETRALIEMASSL